MYSFTLTYTCTTPSEMNFIANRFQYGTNVDPKSRDAHN